ncbi:TPA: O-antigen translocase [Photobacterium damselae]
MKRLLSVTGFTALLTLLRMSTGFLIAKIVAIYTGPSGMAMLGQLQSVVGVLSGIAVSPVSNGVIKYTAENEIPERCSPWWRASIFWVACILSIIIPLGCLFSSYISELIFHDDKYYWLIILISCVLPLVVSNTLINSVLNGLQKYKLYVKLGVIANIVSTILILILIVNNQLIGALIGVALNTTVSGIVMIFACCREPWFRWRYWFGKTDKHSRRKILGYVLMAVTSAITVPISLMFIRNSLISHVGWDLTGQWQAVWRISEVYLSVITLSLSTYYLPRLAKKNDVKEVKREINKTAIVVMPIVVILAFVVYLMRDFAIEILFTSEFRQARELFAIQLSGDVVKILAWLYAFPMLSKGSTKWYVSSEIVFSIIFVALSDYFISTYGVQGANISYLLTYALYFIFSYSILNRLYK